MVADAFPAGSERVLEVSRAGRTDQHLPGKLPRGGGHKLEVLQRLQAKKLQQGFV